MKGESYGYGIWKNLHDEYGMSIKIPSVYQHLSELRTSGLIDQTRIENTYDNRKRAYYALTKKGRNTIKQIGRLSKPS